MDCSNIKVLKICQYCKKEFIARKTTSKICSDNCAKRLYKQKQRDSEIAKAVLKIEIERRPLAYMKEDELRAIQAKENLILQEAAILLNESPLTLRRFEVLKKPETVRSNISCYI
jgi:hypothetical protein